VKFLLRKLLPQHTANKEALERNRIILADAERDAETVEAIRDQAEKQAAKLRQADNRNHYSESLTHAFRGSTA
jgi:hypothetical protein